MLWLVLAVPAISGSGALCEWLENIRFSTQHLIPGFYDLCLEFSRVQHQVLSTTWINEFCIE